MVAPTMEPLAWLRKQLEDADVDLLRSMVATFAHTLMNAEASAICGAGYGERSSERRNSRNGYRERDWDTRAGTIELKIPKLRHDTYYPDWLLETRRRAGRALVAVIAESYLLGVSTRRVDDLVKALGIEGISKSQVSRLAQTLDEEVAAFRSRPLDAGPYPYIWLDALTQRCREGGRIVNVATVVATAVNADGKREVLGVDVVTTEDGAGWTAFLRGLVARGLAGVELVVSDAHGGLKDAIASCLPGAAWQRCRTHCMRNLLTRVPKAAQGMVATLVRTIFAARQGLHAGPARPGGRAAHRALPHRGRHARRRGPGPACVRLVPEGALAPDLEQQSRRAPQPRDSPAHRRRRHLPEPPGDHPAGWSGARRAARRMGRRPALHEPGVVDQGPAEGPRRRRRRTTRGGGRRTHEGQLRHKPRDGAVNLSYTT